MDRREKEAVEQQKQVFGPSMAEDSVPQGKESLFVTENGSRFRIPYKIIRKVTFRDLDQRELKSLEYSARLQYRLLLFDAVVKAKVDYHKKFIRIIYNPPDSDNIREKMSRDKLVEFLASEGVHVMEDPQHMEEVPYDYYKEHYSYAYFPPSIREAPPYGWTREEWKKEKEKRAREKYKEEHPSVVRRLLNKVSKKGQKKQSTGLTMHP